MKNETLRNITNDLFNRQFQIADIKAYLAEKNYSIDEIENVISELKNKDVENSKNKISSKEGLRGIIFIISSLIIGILSFINLGDNDNKFFIYFKILLSISLLIYGLFLVTRPLKKNLN